MTPGCKIVAVKINGSMRDQYSGESKWSRIPISSDSSIALDSIIGHAEPADSTVSFRTAYPEQNLQSYNSFVVQSQDFFETRKLMLLNK